MKLEHFPEKPRRKRREVDTLSILAISPAAEIDKERRATMLKGFILGIIITFIAIAVVSYAELRTGAIPANADAQPGVLEHFAARTDLRAVLQKDAPKGPNPVPLSDGNLVDGIRLYAVHCMICHGTAADDASASPIAKGEYPKPPQLATDGVEEDPEGWTFWKIKHGIRWTGMPSWKDELNDQQIWTLALFLKHMDKMPPAAQAAWRAAGPQVAPGNPFPAAAPTGNQSSPR